MILECFLGSICGATIGVCIGALIAAYGINKEFQRQYKKNQELIEELTTFKIKFEDVI